MSKGIDANQEGIKSLHELRVQIDTLANVSQKLPIGRFVALSITAFQASKMMLGKVLQHVGEANPYPESKNPGSPVIEKTADQGNPGQLDPNLDVIGNIKAIRNTADQLSNSLWESPILKGPNSSADYKAGLFRQEAWMRLQEGMMWLGMELGRIRDEQEKGDKTE